MQLLFAKKDFFNFFFNFIVAATKIAYCASFLESFAMKRRSVFRDPFCIKILNFISSLVYLFLN